MSKSAHVFCRIHFCENTSPGLSAAKWLMCRWPQPFVAQARCGMKRGASRMSLLSFWLVAGAFGSIQGNWLWAISAGDWSLRWLELRWPQRAVRWAAITMKGQLGKLLRWMVRWNQESRMITAARFAVDGRALGLIRCQGDHLRIPTGTLLHRGTWMVGCRAPRIMKWPLTICQTGLGGGVIHGHGTPGRIRLEMAAMRTGCMCPAEIGLRIGEMTLGIDGTQMGLRGEVAEGNVRDNLNLMMRDYLNVKVVLQIKMIFLGVTCHLVRSSLSMRRLTERKRRRTQAKSPALILQFSEQNKARTTGIGRELWNFGWRVRGLTSPPAWWVLVWWCNWGIELLSWWNILNLKM